MSMSSITIRNLDPAIKERLRIRAAEHGHSMEAEVRRILQTALTNPAVQTEAAARAMFVEDFDGRILPFDREAARIYAELFAPRRRAGQPAATMDLMIAAIAQCHDGSVVTRDTSGFDGCGLTLIDPWQAP
jgi:plasmid stability protein